MIKIDCDFEGRYKFRWGILLVLSLMGTVYLFFIK